MNTIVKSSKKILAFVFALAVSAGAHATLMIEIDDLSTAGIDATIADQGLGDMNPLPNLMITANVIINNSVFGINAGSGAPDTGELFDINFLTTLAPNTSWVIRIFDNDYQLGNAIANAASLVTPTTINHMVTVETRIDGQTVLDSTPLQTGVNQAAGTPVTLTQPTTIEHIIRISSNGQIGLTSTFDTRTIVSEPALVGLMGLVLMGLGVIGRRRRA